MQMSCDVCSKQGSDISKQYMCAGDVCSKQVSAFYQNSDDSEQRPITDRLQEWPHGGNAASWAPTGSQACAAVHDFSIQLE